MKTSPISFLIKSLTSVIFISLLWTFGCSNNPLKPDPNLGDLNLNGIRFEVADMVLFSNYLVYGKTVFSLDEQAQIAASDINVDGKRLTVADLVYLGLIVNGIAPTKPKIDPVSVKYTHDNQNIVSIDDDAQIGAVYILVQGQVSPYLLVENMEMLHNFDGINTRILIWSRNANSFTGDFVQVYSEIEYIELATFEGQPVELNNTDDEPFHLNQNYPNPFSDKTRISVALPIRSFVSLEITDAVGRKVYNISGWFEAGVAEFEWNATDNLGTPLSSGIYYCSVTLEGKTQRIKMNLIRT